MNGNKINIKIIIVACVALLLSASIITAAALSRETSDYKSGDIIAEYENRGFNISVKYVEPLETPNMVEAFWLPKDSWSIIEHCDLVVKAQVAKYDEINIEYTREEEGELITREAPGTVLTLNVTETYYNSERGQNVSGEITVYSMVCSRNMFVEDEGKDAKVGEEYYFFLESSKDLASPLGYDRICDYMITLAPYRDYLISSSEPMTEKMAELLNYNVKLVGKQDLYGEGDDLGEALRSLFK